MKAISLKEPCCLEYIEIDEPDQPGPGEVLVRTVRMGVCGTDVSGYFGKMPFIDYPLILGHELGVEVLEVGDAVTSVVPGDRCSVEPYLNCGDCYACQQGKFNCCASLRVLGVMVDGGLRERFTIRADKLHVSKTLTFEQLALVETLGIGCHATDRGDPCQDDHVLIIGAGPIGLATLEFTRLTGAKITVMDINESRLHFCRQTYGVEQTIVYGGDGSELDQMKSITGGDMYSLVTDATGNNRSMENAIQYVAHTGTILFVGITTENVAFPHPALHLREASIKASRNALPENFKRIIQLMEEGTIDTNSWITHRTPFDRIVDEFEDYTKPETGVVKAILEVDI